MVIYGYLMEKYRWVCKYLYLSCLPGEKREPWEIENHCVESPNKNAYFSVYVCAMHSLTTFPHRKQRREPESSFIFRMLIFRTTLKCGCCSGSIPWESFLSVFWGEACLVSPRQFHLYDSYLVLYQLKGGKLLEWQGLLKISRHC